MFCGLFDFCVREARYSVLKNETKSLPINPNSNNVNAKLNTSADLSYLSPRTTSGAIYNFVPTCVISSALSNPRASPKSASFNVQLSATKQLSGFKSLCNIPHVLIL